MAALTRHAFTPNCVLRTTDFLFKNTFTESVQRDFLRGKKKITAPVKGPSLEAVHVSLASKGFMRNYKPYQPANDVSQRLNKICEESGIPTSDEASLESPNQRYNLFMLCEEEFKHSIPNSVLCNIRTIGDLREFYETPVNTSVPLDAMRNADLPRNLHIQYDYHRFHPETDTMFNGKTAFPKSSTIVTGLKYKKKYQGFNLGPPLKD